MATYDQSVHRYTVGSYSNTEGVEAQKHALYRFFDGAGKLLYIGETADPGERFEQHRRQSPWYYQSASITLEWLENREVARAAESAAIQAEKPAWNVVHNNPVLHEPGTIIGIAVVERRKLIAYVGVVASWDKKTMTMCLLEDGSQKTIKLRAIQCLQTGSVEAVRDFKRRWEED